MSVAGRHYLITGAASGIGRATADHLAAAGAQRLVLVDRDATALAALDLPVATDRLAGDVADEDCWRAWAPIIAGIDGAVINAGVAGAARITEHDFAEWRRILTVNLDGAFLTLRAALRELEGRGGAIVAVASATGIRAEAGTAAYAASKAGLIQLARVAAKEGAASHVRVNAIAPGGVETPVWDAVPAFADRVLAIGRDRAFAEMAMATTPLGRFARCDEIARQIAFLLSDDAATITGSVLASDGGYTL